LTGKGIGILILMFTACWMSQHLNVVVALIVGLITSNCSRLKVALNKIVY